MSIGIVPRRNTLYMLCKFYLGIANHAWVVCEASWKELVLENVRQQVEDLTRWQGGAKKGNLDGKAGGKPK